VPREGYKSICVREEIAILLNELSIKLGEDKNKILMKALKSYQILLDNKDRIKEVIG